MLVGKTSKKDKHKFDGRKNENYNFVMTASSRDPVTTEGQRGVDDKRTTKKWNNFFGMNHQIQILSGWFQGSC